MESAFSTVGRFFMVRIVLCVIDDTNIIRFIILVKYFTKYFQKKFAQQKSPAKVCRAVMSHEVMYVVVAPTRKTGSS